MEKGRIKRVMDIKVTEQDNRDIEETIMWLHEAQIWCDINPPEMESEEWERNVSSSVEVAVEWLRRIKGE
jgi:hypothetical protein